ncbi:MAG TPA: glycosyltransferase family 2 protein [Acetobacteraceae bacterium]|nr:glycosyltransferase family 2 protein [Acetobacteraceae bacterium]
MTRTAACVIVKNEARDILEWLAYHSLLGFDALIVFDNDSTDATGIIVQKAMRRFPIHYWPWHRSDPESQTGAYEEACRHFRDEFDWIGFYDADEFLVLHQHESIAAFLAGFRPFAAVAVNWAIFGANGHEDYHRGLVIESFTRRAPADFAPNRHVKSFVRPAQVRRCPNPHFFAVDGAYCDPAGAPVEWLRLMDGHELPLGLSARPPDYSRCQLNHYFTRSRAHWAEKLRRGYPEGGPVRRDEEFDFYNRNEIEDRSACARAAAVRARMTEFADA